MRLIFQMLLLEYPHQYQPSHTEITMSNSSLHQYLYKMVIYNILIHR